MSIESNRQDLFDIVTGKVPMAHAGLEDPRNSVATVLLNDRHYKPFITNWSSVWGITGLRSRPGDDRGRPTWSPSSTLVRSIDAQQTRASERYQSVSDSGYCDCEQCEVMYDDE